MYRRSLFWGTVLFVVGIGSLDIAADNKKHLLVQVVKEDSGFRVVRTTLVNTRIPKQRSRTRFFAWKLKVVGPDKRVIYEAGFVDPTILRGEFANPYDPTKIDAVHLKRTEPIHFTIRLPLLEATSVEFYTIRSRVGKIDSLAEQAFTKLGALHYPKVGH